MPAEEGRTVHLRGRNFSLQLVEPEGWTLDTSSAPQLANFILYPEGEDWRSAVSLISVRFEPREEGQAIENYVTRIGREFEKYCPLGERSERESDLKSPFSLYDFSCPGSQDEIIAVTSVTDYFINISLSSHRPEALEEAYPALEAVLKSFTWKEEINQPTLTIPNRH